MALSACTQALVPFSESPASQSTNARREGGSWTEGEASVIPSLAKIQPDRQCERLVTINATNERGLITLRPPERELLGSAPHKEVMHSSM